MNLCPFCKPSVIKEQSIYETEFFRFFYNLRPVVEGSLLVVPKRHFCRLEEILVEEMEDLAEITRLIPSLFQKVYGINDYFIMQKNGVLGGQTVAHMHFHAIPCRQPLHEFVYRAFEYRDPISIDEMKQVTERLKRYFKTS